MPTGTLTRGPTAHTDGTLTPDGAVDETGTLDRGATAHVDGDLTVHGPGDGNF